MSEIITEKISINLVGLYKWIIEDKIDERDFPEPDLTEFVNTAIKNELIKRGIELTPRQNYRLNDWWKVEDDPKPRIYKIARG